MEKEIYVAPICQKMGFNTTNVLAGDDFNFGDGSQTNWQSPRYKGGRGISDAADDATEDDSLF